MSLRRVSFGWLEAYINLVVTPYCPHHSGAGCREWGRGRNLYWGCENDAAAEGNDTYGRAFWLRFGWLQYSDGGDHVPSVKSMFIPHFFKEIPKEPS